MTEFSTERPLRVAVVGAGPAGVYVADALMKSDQLKNTGIGVAVDLIERQPAPYGLIRYGVAPDHPRIKGIITALRQVMSKPEISLYGNVEFGRDVTLADLQRLYDAVVFTTGAEKDRPLDIPGIDAEGSFGAADFVSWYDGHPDVPRTWPLTAEKVAVIGAGNVGLDVARILAKTADELLVTEIPANVYEGLAASPVKEVHLFARRGFAQAKFTPLETRELDHSPNVEVVVSPEDVDYDEGSMKAIHSDNQTKMVVRELERFATRDPEGTALRTLHLHFFENPAEVLVEAGKVVGFRTERTRLTGNGDVEGTGVFNDWPVQAIYRAVGYQSSPLPGLPWDERTATFPHVAGRVLDADGLPLPGVYTNGWIKRGPVGLIGHTKGDANETVASMLADLQVLPAPEKPSVADAAAFFAERVPDHTTWPGWIALDAHEIALGEPHGRARIKVVEREAMVAASQV